jgi:hypothetical protein
MPTRVRVCSWSQCQRPVGDRLAGASQAPPSQGGSCSSHCCSRSGPAWDPCCTQGMWLRDVIGKHPFAPLRRADPKPPSPGLRAASARPAVSGTELGSHPGVGVTQSTASLGSLPALGDQGPPGLWKTAQVDKPEQRRPTVCRHLLGTAGPSGQSKPILFNSVTSEGLCRGWRHCTPLLDPEGRGFLGIPRSVPCSH